MSRKKMSDYDFFYAYLMNDLYEYRGALSLDDLYSLVLFRVHSHSILYKQFKQISIHKSDDSDFNIIKGQIKNALLLVNKLTG